MPSTAPGEWRTTTESIVWSVVTVTGSFAIGALSLYRTRLPERSKRGLARALEPLRAVHSGHVGDYVAWLTFGVAAIGGLLALTIRWRARGRLGPPGDDVLPTASEWAAASLTTAPLEARPRRA